MKRGTTLFLKIAGFLIGIPVLALCIFLIPEIASYTTEVYPDITYLKYFVLIGLYITVIPFSMLYIKFLDF